MTHDENANGRATTRVHTGITLTRENSSLHSGGTVRYEVRTPGPGWIGWVGDGREWKGSHFGGRRWWACWRQEGDEHARWNSGLVYRTRDAALRDLHLKAGRAFLDARYAAALTELASASTRAEYTAARRLVRSHRTARRLVGLPIDPPEETR